MHLILVLANTVYIKSDTTSENNKKKQKKNRYYIRTIQIRNFRLQNLILALVMGLSWSVSSHFASVSPSVYLSTLHIFIVLTKFGRAGVMECESNSLVNLFHFTLLKACKIGIDTLTMRKTRVIFFVVLLYI